MNEHFLVSGSVCGSAKVWDVRNGSYVTTLLKSGSRVNAIRIVGERHIFVGCEAISIIINCNKRSINHLGS